MFNSELIMTYSFDPNKDPQTSALARAIDQIIKDKQANKPTSQAEIQVIQGIEQLYGKFETLSLDQANPYQQFLFQQLQRAQSYALFITAKPKKMTISSVNHSQTFREPIQLEDGKYFLYKDDVNAYGSEFSNYCQQEEAKIAQKKAKASENTKDKYLALDELKPDPRKKRILDYFIAFYNSCNTKIGGKTQVSNLGGFLKNHLTKVANKVTGAIHGQRKDRYHRHEELIHDYWAKLFLSGQKAIEDGKVLTEGQQMALGLNNDPSNPYYSLAKFKASSSKPQVTHVGHATAFLEMGSFKLTTDPVHYQAGTDGIPVSAGGSLLYPRQTEPAFKANRYPGTQIVWISHNHHDHLCPRTLKESCAPDTLFIVPKGDKQKLQDWGFTNVHEVDSWNESVTIPSPTNPKETLKIHALPAKHASCRGPFDTMEALFMGCIVEYDNSVDPVTRHLVTGDTAVWDDQHNQQLVDWIEKNGPIQSASIASGPDRPRKLMECTHQSTSDALVSQARLSMANWSYYLNNNGDAVAQDFETFISHACQGIAYHQGCYRLGLLSYSDVIATVTRTKTFLSCFDKDMSIDNMIKLIDSKSYQNHFYWHTMDDFEREGVRELLEVYGQVKLGKEQRQLKLVEVIETLETRFAVPKIGDSLMMDNPTPQKQYSFEDSQLIVNWPAQQRLQQQLNAAPPQTNQLYELLVASEKAFSKLSYNTEKSEAFQKVLGDPQFIEASSSIELDRGFDQKKMNQALELIGQLSQAVQGSETHNETIREEGNFQTLMLMLAQQCRETAMQYGHSKDSAEPIIDKVKLALLAMQVKVAQIHTGEGTYIWSKRRKLDLEKHLHKANVLRATLTYLEDKSVNNKEKLQLALHDNSRYDEACILWGSETKSLVDEVLQEDSPALEAQIKL